MGADFLTANPSKAFWYVTIARWACATTCLIGGWACYKWAYSLYGPQSGFLALLLWCFSPNILAYAGTIGSDAGAAAIGVLACYCFRTWLQQPCWRAASVAGIALGLAQLTKMSWLPLFLVWPLVWIVGSLRLSLGWRTLRDQHAHLLLILALAFYVLNLGYAFEGTFSRLDSFSFVSQSLSGNDERDVTRSSAGNRFAGHWLGRLPTPVPAPYLCGLDLQWRDFESQYPCYLRGEYRDSPWYYYLYALAIKVPLGAWVLLAVALYLAVSHRAYRATWQDEVALILAPLVLFLIVSVQSNSTLHFRYALPCLPFAFVFASRVARAIPLGHASVVCVALFGTVWAIYSSLFTYPHSLSYFNEAAGGARRGHLHLIDSSIDWGQDLFRFKSWLESHPDARPLWLTYHGFVDPHRLGIDLPEVPPKSELGNRDSSQRPHTDGWYAISVTRLHSPSNDYAYLRRRKPIATVGYSINIYRLEGRSRPRRPSE